MIEGKKVPGGITFKALKLPLGEHAFIPYDLHILIPKAPKIPVADRHYLAYLPWEHKYLRHVPERYQAFFKYVLPSLYARTSNVHTALSMAQLPGLLQDTPGPVNERLLYLALILHDCGWSQVSQQDLVASFSYNGVAPVSHASRKPKQQHLVYGEALAYKLLNAYDFCDDPLSSEEIYAVSEMIRRHDYDAAWEQGKYGAIGPEIQILCDSDRLWSYTYENFWLDTIRKGVPPQAYLENIRAEIASYFHTPGGKARAQQLITERQHEVRQYSQLLNDAEARAALLQQTKNPSKKAFYRSKQLVHSIKSRRQQRSMIRQNAF